MTFFSAHIIDLTQQPWSAFREAKHNNFSQECLQTSAWRKARGFALGKAEQYIFTRPRRVAEWWWWAMKTAQPASPTPTFHLPGNVNENYSIRESPSKIWHPGWKRKIHSFWYAYSIDVRHADKHWTFVTLSSITLASAARFFVAGAERQLCSPRAVLLGSTPRGRYSKQQAPNAETVSCDGRYAAARGFRTSTCHDKK